MAHAIDTSGLAPEAVQLVENLVQMLRTPRPHFPTVPESADEWVARLRAWSESHPRRHIDIDDSRESIYEGRGE